MGPELTLMDVVDCRVTLRIHDGFEVIEILIGSKDHVFKEFGDTPIMNKILLHSSTREKGFSKEVRACFNATVTDLRE
jgi:hypothetical protein